METLRSQFKLPEPAASPLTEAVASPGKFPAIATRQILSATCGCVPLFDAHLTRLSMYHFTALSSADKLPPSSVSSQLDEELLQPPAKRRRISSSSLSDAEDDEDENKPLASRMVGTHVSSNGTRPHGRRSGKKTSSMKSKAQTAPVSIPPPTGEQQAEMNGEFSQLNGHEPPVKMEDQLDEGQLDLLATGVTVDTASAATISVSLLMDHPPSH